MIKREAQATVLFRHWLKANPVFGSCAFELKQTTTNSIPFSDVQPHQIDALLAVTSPNGLLWKLPDDSRGIKPFDMFLLKSAKAFVVIKYPTCFTIIPIDAFLLERSISRRKSLVESRAREISEVVIQL